jgi:Fe-S oxidoreductase
VLFFTGCYASFKKPQILEAVNRTLTVAGLAYTALGAHESCCGFPVYVAGDDKAEALMRDNATRFQAAGASKVVTACAKCYWMLKEVYPKYAKVDLEVSHAVEVLRELLDEGRLKPRKLELWISYHDPCFLSRYIDLCDDARDILEKIPGIKFVEMAHNKRNSLCCGAGGGVLMTFKDLALKLGRRRIEEALEVEADLLVTSCPFCYANLSEAGRSSLLPVGDIFELVASVL